MKLLKQTLSIALIAISTATMAQPAKEIDLVVNSPQGGSVYKHSTMIADSLTELGYKVNFVAVNTCVNNKTYLENNKDKPAIYLYADSTHNEFAAQGCTLPVNSETFLTTAYYRINAMCTPRKLASSQEDIANLIKQKSTITIAAVTSTPPRVVESMSQWLGKPVKMVPYSKSNDSIRGTLGGDADILYIGLTPAAAENKDLYCWATTAKNKIGDMVPLTTLATNYKYTTIGSYWFIQSNALTGSYRETVKQDLDKIFAQEKWVKYFSSAYMVPGREFKNVGAIDVLKNIDNLK